MTPQLFSNEYIEILNCKDCKNFLRLISQLGRIKKVFYQVYAITSRIEDKVRIIEDDFYSHLKTHISMEDEDGSKD